MDENGRLSTLSQNLLSQPQLHNLAKAAVEIVHEHNNNQSLP
jgi:hypothetical protein